MGYTGKIVSFEPLSDAHHLLKKTSENDAKWIVHTRCAIGAVQGPMEINLAGNSVSSSILPMNQVHLDAAVESLYIGSEQVEVDTINHLWNKYIDASDKVALKIDAQGFEGEVLKGASNYLNQISLLQIELSFIILYEGQDLMEDMLKHLGSLGFTLIDLVPGFRHPKNGDLLQCDGIFARK